MALADSIGNRIAIAGADYTQVLEHMQNGHFYEAYKTYNNLSPGEPFSLYALVGFILSILITAFGNNVIEVGKRKVFLNARFTGKVDPSDLFRCFSTGYLNVVMTMFVYRFVIILTTILFIIPGIYFRIRYFMVSYLVAENPTLPAQRIYEINKATMKGEKMNCLKLMISFLVWFIIMFITCIIPAVFLIDPYYNGTMVEYYCQLKQKALDNGIATPEELGIN